MKRTKNSITIRDVAKAAGVSVSTVSRVLNDKDDVSSETYEHVQTVIAELGYTSSLAAKSMRSRRTNVIGLITPDLADSFCIQVVQGVNQAIERRGFDLLVYTGGNSAAENWARREKQYVSLLNGTITDGVIVVAPKADTFSTQFPLIAVDPHPEETTFPAIIASNRIGSLSLIKHLVELGHKRIGFIGGRPDLQSAQRRLLGYQDGLAEAGIPLEPELILEGDYTQSTGYVCAQRLLSLPAPPTAIFAANDNSAIGVIHAIQEMGLQIPQDISVVGFDNIPEAAYINGGLTTVDQSIQKMGYLAVETLIKLIHKEPLKQNIQRIPTQLIVRNTSGPPRKA